MISEKCLELNVNENLINRIRAFGSHFSSGFIYGFSLRHESVHGLDCSINLPASSRFLFALQYKKPTKEDGGVYFFKINNNTKKDQHIRLLLTYLRVGGNVWYAFPLFIDTLQLSNSSPDFLARTYFAKIVDFPLHTFDRKEHVVEIHEQSGKAYVSSPFKDELKVYDATKFLGEIEKSKKSTVNEIKEKKLTEEEVEVALKELGFEKEKIEIILEVLQEIKRQYVRSAFWF